MKFGKKDHFAKCCQTKGAGSFVKNWKVARAPQKIQRIDEWDDSSDGNESIRDDEKIVLTITGDKNGQFTMAGRINSKPFTPMVDFGSPVTFGVDEIKKSRKKTLFIRESPSDEEYADFNRRKLNLLGDIFCQLEVGNSKLQKARIFVAEKGTKSLIGRDWLNTFNDKFFSPNHKEGKPAIHKINPKSERQAKPNKTSELSNNSKINFHNETNEQTEIKEQFKPLFTRQRRLNGHEVKIEFKTELKVTKQKGKKKSDTITRDSPKGSRKTIRRRSYRKSY